MALTTLNLAEPLVTAMVTLLKANLNTTIDSLNATITDGFLVPHAVQILDYVPVPSTLQGGMPIVGVQELPSQFQDDLQFSMTGVHNYSVVATIQNADQETLVKQLRRTMQAIGATVQADRLLGDASVMRTQGGAWSVNFINSVPGPLLGDLDPINPEAPPRAYLSYTGLTFWSDRTEI